MKKSHVVGYSALLLLLGSVCSQAQQSLTSTRNGDSNAGGQAVSNVSTTASPEQSQFGASGPIVEEQHPANLPTYTVVYTFTGGADGGVPLASLIRDMKGNLYGTTSSGGNDNCSSLAPGCGVVFKVDGADNETVLYTFTGGADGASPFADLTGDAKGNLYGTTESGGSGSAGTVFRLEPPAQPGGTWTETVLHSFCSATNCADGNTPYAGVIPYEGNLYGTTVGGGEFCIDYGGCGVVFKLDSTGNESVLYNFCPNGFGSCTDGAFPTGPVIHDAAGNLYGTTQGGGSNGQGTVFKLSPTGAETWLYSFAGGADGALPTTAGVIQDEAGNLYGTTELGGLSGSGTVFKIDAAGKETVLYSFTGGTDGGLPIASLIRDAKDNLYGTALAGGLASCSCGVVFKLDQAGKETVLYTFTGGADGSSPYAGLMWGKAAPFTALLGTAEPTPTRHAKPGDSAVAWCSSSRLNSNDNAGRLPTQANMVEWVAGYFQK